jgi:hypothetical protein
MMRGSAKGTFFFTETGSTCDHSLWRDFLFRLTTSRKLADFAGARGRTNLL